MASRKDEAFDDHQGFAWWSSFYSSDSSAPAGFGKTTLLSSWAQSSSQDAPEAPHVAWVSLDEGDNDPVLFWTYALKALDNVQPGLFTALLDYLQTQQATTPIRYVLQVLINSLASKTGQFLLVFDDYHLITKPDVHSSLTYLVEHLPPQLHLILATRVDPPLPLSLLRSRAELLEVRTNQLRCTPEEVMAFFKEVMDIELPEDIIQDVTARTEGWLVGLQLLGLSLQRYTDPSDAGNLHIKGPDSNIWKLFENHTTKVKDAERIVKYVENRKH